MRKKVAFALLMLLIGSVKMAHAIQLPFSEGESWYACQGYDGTISHSGAPALDLSVDPASPGPTGCYAGANASTGRIVIAPWKGKVSFFGRSDMVCITREDGLKSMAIGHLDPGTKLQVGSVIESGDYLGVVATPNNLPPEIDGNGGYAHIHVQGHEGAGCIGSLVPFDSAHGMRFEGDAPDMPYNGSVNQYSGVKLTKVAASTWHPNGTLVRDAVTGSLYYLENGKKRLVIASYPYFLEENVIVVSPKELSCYNDGSSYNGSPTQGWGGYPEGSLLRAGVPVFVISEGQPHHLDMNAEEFVSFGYKWSSVIDVNYTPNGIDPVKSYRFQNCQNGSSLGTNPWQQQGGNSRLAVMTDRVGPQVNPVIGSDGYFSSTPDDILVSKEGTIFALSYYSGESLQAFSSGGLKKWGIRGTGEAVLGEGSDNIIYAIGCDGVYKALIHIDPATGTVRNSFRLAFDGDIGSCGWRSSMSLYGDTIYLLNSNGNFLYAIRKSDGALKWRRASGNRSDSDLYFDAGFPPTVGTDGTVYIARWNGILVAINPDGTIKWSAIPTTGFKHFPPRVNTDGTVFYATSENEVVNNKTSVRAFNPANGSVVWEIRKDAGWYLKAVGPDGVYLKNQSGLLSLVLSTGSEKWRRDIDTSNWKALTIGADGILYVRGNYNIQALFPSTGNEQWRAYGNYDPLGTEIAINTDGSLVFISGRSNYYISILKTQ